MRSRPALLLHGGAGGLLHLCDQSESLKPGRTTGIEVGREARADGRALALSKEIAPHRIVEMEAADAGWLAIRHSGDRRRDRNSDAACAAVATTVHVFLLKNVS